jgi:hypothetical protein
MDHKYLKYKSKYLNLKNIVQYGSGTNYSTLKPNDNSQSSSTSRNSQSASISHPIRNSQSSSTTRNSQSASISQPIRNSQSASKSIKNIINSRLT